MYGKNKKKVNFLTICIYTHVLYFLLLQFSIIAKAYITLVLLSSDVLEGIVVSFPPPFAVNA